MREESTTAFGQHGPARVNRIQGAAASALVRIATVLSLFLVGMSTAGSALAAEVTFSYQGQGQSVFLAGSFNNWNASGQSMTDADGDGVWTATLDLADGVYEYKFVVDGNWITDDKAASFKDDGFGGKNSIVEVKGGSVVGAGQATGSAARTSAGMSDAANPNAAGGATSAANAGGSSGATAGSDGTILFRHRAPGAQNAFVAGSFNNWNASGQAMVDPDGDGTWEARVTLAPGTYEYKFVIDGNWITDETAANFKDDGFGGKNSIIEVAADGSVVGGGSGRADAGGLQTGGFTPGAADAQGSASGGSAEEVTFRYEPVIGGERDIFVAGSFNSWAAEKDRLTDPDGDGVFEATLSLPPGRHTYKFVVQGQWFTDENASEFEDDGFGGRNSVVLVGSAASGGGSGATGSAEGLFEVEFAYTPGSAPQSLFVAGSFNEWNTSATPMTDPDGDGTYKANLVLPGGEYQYKFVADGNWITDESAANFADDGFGGRNSVVRVDDRMGKVEMKVGDGDVYTEGLSHSGALAERNILSDREVAFRARAYKDDIEGVDLFWRPQGSTDWSPLPFEIFSGDVSMDHYEARLRADAPFGPIEYAIVYRDGGSTHWLGPDGFAAGPDPEGFRAFAFDPSTAPRFETPDWVRDGIFYQIFPDRFFNGDRSNDPDFDEWYYKGKTRLPRVGKHNGEYYHLVDDWYDVDGLSESPYRNDGKPDYFSFYGGDIEGVRQKLGYLKDLGITIIYFNPVFQAKSNHKYDAASYEEIDPAFGDFKSFRAFVDEAHALGIRVVLDTVFNHTGSSHWAFKDCVDKGPDSEYWTWFEWKKWPLPTSDPAGWKAEDYYECWWGFGDLPDVNFDLKNTKTIENGVVDIADAEPNQVVVDYLLKSVRSWLTELDVDGFRLDVPNEVPMWFWEIFTAEVRKVKPDAYIVAELWGDASSWVGPGMVDATMNYKFFREPVTKWIAKGNGSAAEFDRELAPGRFVYPPQAQQAMMNLIDSHDTVRFRTQANGNADRLRLAATFQMTYVGAPHVYYGDEIAMEGGADPDCRRPFRWKWMEQPERAKTLAHYKTLTALRNGSEALRRGTFKTLLAKEQIFAYARQAGSETVIVVLNNSSTPVELDVPLEGLGVDNVTFDDALRGGKLKSAGGSLPVQVGPTSGAVYVVE